MTASASHGLNLAQQEAVNFLHGPCLVLAGAGSGKTRVITHKIGRLIQAGLAPKRIAAITFTNKAAAEMRERARGLIGRAAKDVVICTFHALGVKMMREDGHVMGLKPSFSILDSDDVTSILKDAGGTTDASTARNWQWTISLWKNMGLNAEQSLARAATDEERHIALVMSRYEERLTAYQSVDFDDLISMPLRLLTHYDVVRDKWQRAMGHILVDEYQDTNATQYEVLKLLVGDVTEKARFTAVGDDDQSIYGWRGATLENLKKLPVDFPTLKVIKLEQNYRSTSAILNAANNVIGPNPKLFPKNLWSDLGDGEPVRIVDADTEEHEAERTVARIQSLRAGTSLQHGQGFRELKDFAILYRANHQAKAFEKALRRAQIPYKVSGGTSFFDRSEIKDLCGWFRLWINNDDDPAFLRAITTPKRGIGHQTLGQLGSFAGNSKLSLFSSLFAGSLGVHIKPKALAELHEFGRYINDLAHQASQAIGAGSAKRFLESWLKEINYEQHLYDSEDSDKVAASRWENVSDFCEWMSARCGGALSSAADLPNEPKSLLEVAQTISLLSTLSEREQDQNVVTLSTLHASKGLEWPHVMLVGATEGMLPFKLEKEISVVSHDTKSALPSGAHQINAEVDTYTQRLEEERRLMYVGITRAQRTLAVSWTRRRKKGRELIAAQPSRFIKEMGLDHKTTKEDPRAKLRALREEFARKVSST